MRLERALALTAIAAAAVAIVAVFLPWFETSMTSSPPDGPVVHHASSTNGIRGPFRGTTVLILAAVGIFGSTIVAAGRDDLIQMRRPWTAGLVTAIYGVAALYAFLDVRREAGGGAITMGHVSVEAAKTAAPVVTFAAALLATIATATAAGLGAFYRAGTPVPRDGS